MKYSSTYFFSELRKNRKKYVGVLFKLYFAALLLIFLGLILLSFLLGAQVEIKIIIKNGRNFSFIIIRLLKLLQLRLNLSIRQDEKGVIALTFRKTDSNMEKQASVDQAMDIAVKLLHIYNKYKEQFVYMRSKLQFNNFNVRTRIGTGDAAATALASGGFFTIFSIISMHLRNTYHLSRQKLNVVPYFQGPLFDLDLDCIINFKIGHIIITGFKMLKKKMKAV
jgi:hypothetical protein